MKHDYFGLLFGHLALPTPLHFKGSLLAVYETLATERYLCRIKQHLHVFKLGIVFMVTT